MELPKLPVTNIAIDGLWESQYGPYTAEQMQEYARQAVLMERERLLSLFCQPHKEYFGDAIQEAIRSRI